MSVLVAAENVVAIVVTDEAVDTKDNCEKELEVFNDEAQEGAAGGVGGDVLGDEERRRVGAGCGGKTRDVCMGELGSDICKLWGDARFWKAGKEGAPELEALSGGGTPGVGGAYPNAGTRFQPPGGPTRVRA